MHPEAFATLSRMLRDWGCGATIEEDLAEAGHAWLATEDDRYALVYLVRAGMRESVVQSELNTLAETRDAERIIVVCMRGAKSRFNAVKSMARVHVWTEDELIIDPAAHEIVPQASVVSAAHAAALRPIIDAGDMQPMHRCDMLARYHGFMVGQVIQIRRKTESGRDYKYRIIVE